LSEALEQYGEMGKVKPHMEEEPSPNSTLSNWLSGSVGEKHSVATLGGGALHNSGNSSVKVSWVTRGG